jgi:cob(I)alamin adenosyltransferase
MLRGTVQVYTGKGKGKTTAALGQALRAWGHGYRILIIQFMKGKIDYGEVLAAQRMEGFDIEQHGLPTFVKKGEPSAQDLALARKGLERAREAIAEGSYDMVILDELNVAIEYGLVTLDDCLSLIRSRTPTMELIITGRYAPQEVIDAADLVSEVTEVKHHYQAGIAAREGIEY